MSFTYDLTAPVADVSRVRFHISDTDEDTAIFSDDEIAFAIDEAGDWQRAVVMLIRSVLAKLAAEPDMQADWLRIDWRRSADGWKALLSEKKQQFGLGARSATAGRHAYRPDSLQKEPPDYEETP